MPADYSRRGSGTLGPSGGLPALMSRHAVACCGMLTTHALVPGLQGSHPQCMSTLACTSGVVTRVDSPKSPKLADFGGFGGFRSSRVLIHWRCWGGDSGGGTHPGQNQPTPSRSWFWRGVGYPGSSRGQWEDSVHDVGGDQLTGNRVISLCRMIPYTRGSDIGSMLQNIDSSTSCYHSCSCLPADG